MTILNLLQFSIIQLEQIAMTEKYKSWINDVSYWKINEHFMNTYSLYGQSQIKPRINQKISSLTKNDLAMCCDRYATT